MSDVDKFTALFDKMGIVYERSNEHTVFEVPDEELGNAPAGLKTSLTVELTAFCFDDNDRFVGVENWETLTWVPRKEVPPYKTPLSAKTLEIEASGLLGIVSDAELGRKFGVGTSRVTSIRVARAHRLRRQLLESGKLTPDSPIEDLFLRKLVTDALRAAGIVLVKDLVGRGFRTIAHTADKAGIRLTGLHWPEIKTAAESVGLTSQQNNAPCNPEEEVHDYWVFGKSEGDPVPDA